MQIATGLHWVGSDIVNSYLIAGQDGDRIEGVDATWVLPGHGPAWDGGVPEAARLIREAAAQSRR
jgi:glyoxylase-like metal-dependent hydrolase (beta-lactamase superfamily II)